MNVTEVRKEINSALATISGLNNFPFHAGRITPPASIVDLPESITFDGGYGRGMDLMVVPFSVVVGKLTAESSEEELADYLAGSGPRSVKAAVERHIYISCDSVVVTDAETAVMTFASVQYLGALFSSNVVGRGA